jgi:hypothetical protein
VEAVAPTLRSIFPQHPGRWLLTRVSFYVLVALIAAAAFFIFAPLFEAMAQLLQRLSPVLALDLLCAIVTLADLWAGLTRLTPALFVFSGLGWMVPARARVQELVLERDLLQKQLEWKRQDLEHAERLLGQVTSKAAMTQAIGEALRGGGWTMDEQELANIVSRAMVEMNKIAEQQAVDHPSQVHPRRLRGPADRVGESMSMERGYQYPRAPISAALKDPPYAR